MMHVPRLPSEKVSPPWLKAFLFRTAPGEVGALRYWCPAALTCPGWSVGRGQCECLFLIQLMLSSTMARYSCHSPRTDVDPLLMGEESIGDLSSMCP